MRKNLFQILMAVAVAAVAVSCSTTSSKEPVLNVEEANYPLVMDYTATWCGPCGESGTPMFKKIASENPESSFMAVHTTTSELVAHLADANFSPAVWGMFLQLGINSNTIPIFSVNGVAVTTNEKSIKEAMSRFKDRVVEAGVNFTASKSAKGIDINYKAKFFSEVSGEYFLAFYLTEDGVIHRQKVGSAYQSGYEHSKALRAILNPVVQNELRIQTQQGTATVFSSFGQELVKGEIAKDEEFSGKVNFVYDADKFDITPRKLPINSFVWDAANKYNVVAVIWRKTTNNYVFVNSKTVKL